ncbi:2-dehydropantoate 2-reductase (plasmid) [Arthrobacter sp. D3-18]
MKTAIVGSGAMGQLFGARLLLAGNDVVFLDTNQQTIDTLNDNGVTLTTDMGTEHVPARAARAADLTEPMDLFIVFTKSFHTNAAVASVSHLIASESCGLTLQNGLGNAEVLQNWFGQARALLGITDFPADLKGPGVVVSHSSGKVRLGSLDPSPSLPAVAALLDSAGLNAAAEPDIRVPVWEKVAFNSALNTLSAVTGMTVGQIGDDPHARGIVASVIAETVAVASSLQISISTDRIDAAMENAFMHHTHHKTSMLLDREAGRPTEIDSIGGGVVRIGQENGAATPVLQTLCELLRAVTSSGSKP